MRIKDGLKLVMGAVLLAAALYALAAAPSLLSDRDSLVAVGTVRQVRR